MNRRMRRERERAKFEAARQRALARLAEQWGKLSVDWRVSGMDDEVARIKGAIRKLDSQFHGTARVLLLSCDGVHMLGAASVAFAAGLRHAARQQADQARELVFIEAGMATGSSPADPWPCGDCMVETRQQPILGGRSWRTVERTRTCDMCRAQGAPEYLP